MSEDTIAARLAAATASHGPKIALSCLGEDLSYAEFEAAAAALAAYMQGPLGLKKGDRLAIMLPNIAQFPVVFYAAQKLGLICVCTNPLYTPREMRHQFQDAGVSAIVIIDIFVSKLVEIIADTNIKHIVSASIGDHLPRWKGISLQTVLYLKKLLPKNSLNMIPYAKAIAIGKTLTLQPVAISPDDLALLQYTGGTTGLAKGAMLSQRNILANVHQLQSAALAYVTPGEEIVLTALPLYHIFALTVNFLAFVTMGMRMVLIPRPIPIKNTVAAFKRYRITVMTGVNTIFNALIHDPAFQKLGPSDFKFAIAGGMALQETVAKRFAEITGCHVVQGYGLTEASPVTHLCPLDSLNSQSIGLPLPGTEAKIIGDAGHTLGTNEIGELLVRGPQVMQGYWQRPDETAKVMRDGWLCTGDIARREEDGLYYIVDRKKDMILVSGFNVFPNEVEEVLSAHPKILEAAVIGIPHEASGEAVKAFIVAKDQSLTADELDAYCRTQLTGYKRPKTIEFRRDLPKSNVGKVLRRELREEWIKANAPELP